MLIRDAAISKMSDSIGPMLSRCRSFQARNACAEGPFRSAPVAAVSKEMRAFLKCQTARGSGIALTRSGIAHPISYRSTHSKRKRPPSDARSQKKRSRRAWATDFDCIGGHDLARRREYYDALEAANKKKRNPAWLLVVCGMVIAGQRSTIANVEFLIAKTRLLGRCEAS